MEDSIDAMGTYEDLQAMEQELDDKCIENEKLKSKLASLKGIISDLEYAAFNLLDGQKDTDLPDGLSESTNAGDSLLIAIRNLKAISA